MQMVSFKIIESVGCIFPLCVISMVSPSRSLTKDGFVEVILESKVSELTIGSVSPLSVTQTELLDIIGDYEVSNCCIIPDIFLIDFFLSSYRISTFLLCLPLQFGCDFSGD